MRGEYFAGFDTLSDRGRRVVEHFIGRDRAVARLGRLEFYGCLARMLWAVVHIALVGEVRNRFMVLREWLWARFTEHTYGRETFSLLVDYHQSSKIGILCAGGGCRPLFCFHQGHVNQVFAQEPDLQFIGAEHVADHQIVRAIITKFSRTAG